MSKASKSIDDNAPDADDATSAAAFQEFMLRGKGAKPQSTPNTPVTPSSHSSGKKSNEILQSTPRRKPSTHSNSNYRPILKALQGRLEDWHHTDQQLENVISSIHNLRCRLKCESDMLEQNVSGYGNESSPMGHLSTKSWSGCGFRNNGSNNNTPPFLEPDDIQHALDHDLLQHERMIALLRSLMASLAQTLDAIGRRLDEWMMMQDGGLGWSDVGMYQTSQQIELLSDAQQHFALLSEALYCKQVAVQHILDSCHDGILEEDAKQNIVTGKQPYEIAQQAMKQWRSKTSNSEKDALMERFLAIR